MDRQLSILLSVLLIISLPVGSVAGAGSGADQQLDPAAWSTVSEVSGADWTVRASDHSETLSVDIDSSGDLVVRATDETHSKGRSVALPVDRVRDHVDEIPDRLDVDNSEGDGWISETRLVDGFVVVELDHFSTNTISFSGQYSLSASAAEDGSSFNYQLDSGDVDNIDLTMTGRSRINNEIKSQTVADGDSIPITVEGTEDAMVDISMDGLVSDGWSNQKDMPTARYGLSLGSINGQLYAVGGDDGSSRVSTVERYDPATDSWTTLNSMPTARSHLGLESINGQLYAVGGYDGSDVSTVERYDPATDSWTTLNSMPTARSYLGLESINGQLYAVGGKDGSRVSTVERYSTAVEDPTVSLDGSTISHSGRLEDGESESGSISVAPGSYSADLSASSQGELDLSLSWSEETLSQNPELEINGQRVGYSGTLSPGQTAEIDTSGVSISSDSVNIDVSVASGTYPTGSVGFNYSHDATHKQSVDYNGGSFEESYNVSKTFATDVNNGELLIPLASERIIEIRSVDYYRDGSPTATSYNWDQSTNNLVVDLGDISAGTQNRVVVNTRKVTTPEGSISVAKPTREGDTLNSRLRVESSNANGRVKIDVGNSYQVDKLGRILYTEDETMSAPDTTVELNNQTQILSVSGTSGAKFDVVESPFNYQLDQGDDVALSEIEDLDTAGDVVVDVFAGDVQLDLHETPDSNLLIDKSDSSELDDGSYVTIGTDGNYHIETGTIGTTTSGIAVTSTGSTGGDGGLGLGSPLLLFVGLAGVVGSVVLRRRFNLPTRTTGLVALVAIGGVAELGTPGSVIGTVFDVVFRFLSELLNSVTGGIFGLAAGSPVSTLFAGVGMLIGIYLLSERFGLPTYLQLGTSVLVVLWIIDSISGGLLTSGLDDLGPLLWILLIGGSIVLVYRALDSRDIVIGGDG